MDTPRCQHCKGEMKVNKYQKPYRGTEVFTFACYKCGVVQIKTYKDKR